MKFNLKISENELLFLINVNYFLDCSKQQLAVKVAQRVFSNYCNYFYKNK